MAKSKGKEALTSQDDAPKGGSSVSDQNPAFDWEDELKRLLKGELARRGVRYPELVRRLAAMGVKENEANIRNKISRGNFSAIFLVQCLIAAGITAVELPTYPFPPGTEPPEWNRLRRRWNMANVPVEELVATFLATGSSSESQIGNKKKPDGDKE